MLAERFMRGNSVYNISRNKSHSAEKNQRDTLVSIQFFQVKKIFGLVRDLHLRTPS